MDRPKSAAIAKWGAACAPCANAKAKCLRSNGNAGAKCDRCDRLEKDCVDQVHRPRKKRQSKPSRTAQLEERLNNLVDLIKASNAGELPASFKNPPSLEDDFTCIPNEIPSNGEQKRSSVTSSEPAPTGHSSVGSNRTVPRHYNDYAPPTCICRAPVGEIPVPVESDDTLLSTFVTKLSPQVPFVVLRPGISAQELESTRPFLFSVIKMVSSVRHLKSMRAQSYLIMKHISEHMVMRSERSLELLQGILLVLGWYHYHCMMHAQMSNLNAMATALVADLGINRAPELQERTRVLVLYPEQPEPRTNDERRALCGTWYLNSVVSLAFQKTEHPRFSPYLDRCLRELEADNEYETDALLIQLMRIQHLSDRISEIHAKDQDLEDFLGIPRAPVSAYQNAFQTELDKFRSKVPRHLKSHMGLQIHINTANLRLWEPPTVDKTILENLSNSFTFMSLGKPSTLDTLYRSNVAIKAWFECWLSIEVTDYFYLTMPACAQLIIAITMLARWAKLSSVDAPTGKQPGIGGSLAARAAAENITDPSESGPESNRSPEANMCEDAAIPAGVAALASIKAQIMSQPDLQIDIVGVLRALVGRFEDARSEVNTMQGGVWDSNIWDLAAKKISITRLKLERWTEIVSTMGIEGLLTRKMMPGEDRESATDDSSNSGSSETGKAAWPMEGVEASECTTIPAQGGQDPGGVGWQYNNMFANDLFDGLGLDQNFFYDDGGDYGTIVLNSLQPMPGV